ncbi:MAG: hypothetical protein EZS28_032850 [Streblomastix strix]|uniref:Condensin complex subunit 1 C-terminal domain-containing protein n=1 Tax=Streblomastix strix TaxID=222440 RepID=A0A5J4UMV6_9EUKA|nr:MAG: hypothetical protein EZS28_032850 [Streblomastix strix]
MLLALDPYPALLRLLDHTDEDIISDTISSIYKLILTGKDTTPQNSKHPHFETMSAACGIEKIFKLFQRTACGIEQIFKLFQRNNQNEDIKDTASLCLGRLFRAKDFPNELMKNQIVNHIKSLKDDANKWTRETANDILEELTCADENQDDDTEEDEDQEEYEEDEDEEDEDEVKKILNLTD